MTTRQPRTRNARGIANVSKRIRSVDDLGPYVNVGVFGNNGSGKTRFSASAPKCLIVDINERGTRSAVGTGTHVLEVAKWEDVTNCFWFLKSGSHDYESVAIDTTTALNNLALRFVLGEQEQRDLSRIRDMPDKRSYGKAGQLVMSMIWAYRNLDMHTIFTGQVRTITDEDTGEVLDTTFDLPAGSRGALLGAVSVLGYMTPTQVRVTKGNRTVKVWQDRMLLGPHKDYSCLKDRTNKLGPILAQPTMRKVIRAWHSTNGNEDE